MNQVLPYLAAGATDPGLRRTSNEDGFFVDEAHGLFMVADGMGGHAQGEVASAEVLASMAKALLHAPCADGRAAERTRCVRDAICEANGALYQLNCVAGMDIGCGMGTAVAGIWLGAADEPAVFFHVGDCRIYVWRGGQLTRLTSDHSAYQEWIDGGAIGVPPSRHLLSRCIGPHPDVEPELQMFTLQRGDRCLICSDGLTAMLADDELAWLLGESHAHPLSVACQRFINEANDRGGADNITVVSLHVRG